MKALDPNRKIIPYPSRVFLLDLWRFLGPEKRNFVLGSFCRLASDLLALYPSIALAGIVNLLVKYTPGAPLRSVWVYVILYAITAILRPVFQNLGKTLVYTSSVRANQNLKIRAGEHMMYLSALWHETESSGGKFQRLNTGADGLGTVYSIWVNNLISVIVNIGAVPIIIATFDRSIGVACFIFTIVYTTLQIRFTKRVALIQNDINLASEKASGSLFDTIGNFRTIKVLGAIPKMFVLIRANILDVVRKIELRIRTSRSQNGLLNVFFQIFRVIVLVFSIFAIIKGQYEVGFLFILNTYLMRVWESADELGGAYQEIVVAKYSISRIKEVLDMPWTVSSEENKIKLVKGWKGISIENLTFQYADNTVLSDVSFKIKRGEKIGIIGLSGAGKSTLFKLLLKEYEDYKGLIKFDDLSLRDVSPRDYYTHTAVVLQETEVFNFSLKDNVTIGNDKFDGEAFERALDVSHVRGFLHKLKSGVETVIGEKGVKLSGGEKQRLGIARAVYKSPELLLMDEATSHLDIESEKTIQDSLHKFFESVTAIVIAHRLTTIKEMDRIIVIEEGKIIEEGSFSKLMRTRGGRFKELWNKQKI